MLISFIIGCYCEPLSISHLYMIPNPFIFFHYIRYYLENYLFDCKMCTVKVLINIISHVSKLRMFSTGLQSKFE